MKTRIFYERKGNEKAKARIEMQAADEVFRENERFRREQITAKYLIEDLKIERAYRHLSNN